MLNNTSAAATPSNVVNSQNPVLQFFGISSVSQTSPVFTVDQLPVYISAYNLQAGDAVKIQQVFDQGSMQEVADFAPVFGAVTLSFTRTSYTLTYPGRYRLVHSGPSALGTFTVIVAASTMTNEPIGDIASALYSASAALISPFTYLDLGTVDHSPVNVDWTQAQAQKIIVGTDGFYDIEFNVMPKNPGFLIFRFTQPAAGGQLIQFAGSTTFINTGSVQPSQAANASTLYIFFYDGINTALVWFGSDDNTVGAYQGDNATYVGGDNIVRNVQNVIFNYGTSAIVAGTDTYTASLGSGYTQYTPGATINIKFTNANTGAATINLNSLGAKSIQRRGVNVTAGQIPANSFLSLVYDGTVFQILGAA